MSKNCLKITGLSLLALCMATTAFADSKVRARYSSGSQTNETTILTKGTRQRLEYGTGMSAVTQCDLKRMVQIMDKTKSYLVMPLDGNPGGPPSVAPAQTAAVTPAKHGVVTYTTTVTDTGERQQLFGYTARHLKIIVAKEVSPEACDQKKERIETDGWYIDFDQSFACTLRAAGTPTEGPGARTRFDTTEFKRQARLSRNLRHDHLQRGRKRANSRRWKPSNSLRSAGRGSFRSPDRLHRAELATDGSKFRSRRQRRVPAPGGAGSGCRGVAEARTR